MFTCQCQCKNEGLSPIYKGDDAAFELEILEDDGQKMDFYGKTVKFIIKKNKMATDETAIFEQEYTPQESTTTLDITLSKQDTDVAPGIYCWAVRVIAAGLQITEGEGRLEIKQGGFYGQ